MIVTEVCDSPIAENLPINFVTSHKFTSHLTLETLKA